MRKPIYSTLSIAAILVILIWVNLNMNWNREEWKQIIRVDGKGYYAYLPAVFIYHDLNLGFFDKIEKEKYFNSDNFFDYRTGIKNTYIDKYFCGTSVAQLPFFLMAHLWCCITSGDRDGYSKPYMIMISIASLFYLMLGLFFLRKLLRFYNIRDEYVAVVLIAIVFGTNLFYYTVCESGMSHVYSFGILTMMLYSSQRFFVNLKPVNLLLAGALLGLVTLIRPVNVISVLVLPFLAGSPASLKTGLTRLWEKKMHLTGGLVLFLLILSLQPVYYKLSAGSFFIYSYGTETFNFLEPHISDILFSYRKGLFLYTPLLFLSLAGGYYLFRQNKFAAASLGMFFLILTYVLSCWFIWWYGGSFSGRVFIEYFALFGILLGIALEKISLRWMKKVYLGMIFLFILVCQIQTYQYRYYKIHWSDMTEEKYWKVFLRIDQLM